MDTFAHSTKTLLHWLCPAERTQVIEECKLLCPLGQGCQTYRAQSLSTWRTGVLVGIGNCGHGLPQTLGLFSPSVNGHQWLVWITTTAPGIPETCCNYLTTARPLTTATSVHCGHCGSPHALAESGLQEALWSRFGSGVQVSLTPPCLSTPRPGPAEKRWESLYFQIPHYSNFFKQLINSLGMSLHKCLQIRLLKRWIFAVRCTCKLCADVQTYIYFDMQIWKLHIHKGVLPVHTAHFFAQLVALVNV